MKISTGRLIAAAAALACIAGAASCGKDVPNAEQNQQQPGLSVSGGAVTSTQPAAEDTTSAEETEDATAATTTGVTVGKPPVSGVTLSYTTADVSVGQTITYPVVYDTIDEVWTSSNEEIATVDSVGNITGKSEGTCTIRVADAGDSSKGAEVKVTVKKSTGVEVNNGLTYIGGILIANKSYSLPESYDPGGLTAETNTAFQELVEAAANDGLTIYCSSGYRSYSLQSQIYNNYCNAYGQGAADTFSARPGYSEHQTGMAIDVNTIDDSFTGTPEAIWIEQHCNEYGFILRYPYGKQEITGYKYEPWHIRYIGKENAKAFREEADKRNDVNLTLEEYLDIDSYYH